MPTKIILSLGFLPIAWIAPFVSSTAADVFHVAPPPSGSDAHPGTDAEPWATLQHAADSVVAGDTVIVHGGDYVSMQITTSGTAALPITFRAADGETARVVADNASTPDGINVEGADHVVIEHGIYVSNSGDRPVIRGNLIFGNHANGIHMNGDASLGGDGVISDAVVEDNVIFDNGEGGGSGINCDGVQDSLIRNNLIYDTHASGISLYRIDGVARPIGPASDVGCYEGVGTVFADGFESGDTQGWSTSGP